MTTTQSSKNTPESMFKESSGYIHSRVIAVDVVRPASSSLGSAPTAVATERVNEGSVSVTKPYCDHKRGTWCACVKFMSKKPVHCRICGYIIDNPQYTPAPHDAHGSCYIEEGHANYYTADPQPIDGVFGGE